jgi:hypothetical protein|tara:strand:+ start:1834 stop:2193 length:360 start_codon:yes stop_codon:yes gene_type:complete
MTAPNIAGLTSVTGKTAVLTVGQALADLVSNPAASNKVLKINSLSIANVDASSSSDVSVWINRGAFAYFLAKGATVAVNETLAVLTKGKQIYLEEGDALAINASTDGDLHAICSYEEIQ